MGHTLLPTTVVGSYAQPGWLINRDPLGSRVPRIRAPEIRRLPEPFLEEAQDDATLLAIRDSSVRAVGPASHRRPSHRAGRRPATPVALGLAAEPPPNVAVAS